MSEASTIKPGLIIYRAPRHIDYDKNNIKYRFISNQVKYSSWRNDPKKKKDEIFISKNIISEITVSLNYNAFKNSQFLQILSRNRSIRRLNLDFHYYKKLNDSGRASLFKQIKKTFILCSRVQKISISFQNDFSKSYYPFPFRFLALARSLASLSCSPDTPYIQHFQNLFNYLIGANRKGLKHTYLCLESTKYHDKDDREISLLEVQKTFAKIKEISQNIFLKISYKDERQFQDLFSREMDLPLQNLVELNIRSTAPDSCQRQFLDKIQDRFISFTKLRKITLDLLSLSFEYSFESLSRLILGAKFLTTLEISLDHYEKDESLNRFVGDLKGCLNLSSLSLSFTKCTCINNSFLLSLMQSLQSLQELRNFSFWTTEDEGCAECDYWRLQEKTPTVKDFFIDIGKLQNLKSFVIQLNDAHLKVSNDEFIALCCSLKKLTQLQDLHLSFPDYSTIEDTGIEVLSRKISALEKLQAFGLILKNDMENWDPTNKILSEKSNKLLFGTLATLKSLSSLELSLDCQEVSSELVKSLTPEFSKMESLKYLDLCWWTPDEDSDAVEDLELIDKLFMFKTSLEIKRLF